MNKKKNNPHEKGESTTCQAVLNGTIGLSELIGIVKTQVSNTQITMGDVAQGRYKDQINTVARINTQATEEEKDRLKEVEGFLGETSEIRKDFNGEVSIQESAGKKYLVFDKENIYEILKQIGENVIIYNPINRKYIIYNLKSKKVENFRDFQHFKDFNKKSGEKVNVFCDIVVNNAGVEGYYKVIIKEGNQEKTIIYHIEPNNDFKNLGEFYLKGNLDKHGKSLFLNLIHSQMNIIKSNGETLNLQCYGIYKAKTASGKNLLIIKTQNILSSMTIYDCDNEKIIASKIVIKGFDYENPTPTLDNIIQTKTPFDNKWGDYH